MKIILSYFFPENLKNKGQYFDKYFSIKTQDIKILLDIDTSRKL